MDVTCWRGDGGERKMKKAVCFIGGVGGGGGHSLCRVGNAIKYSDLRPV